MNVPALLNAFVDIIPFDSSSVNNAKAAPAGPKFRETPNKAFP